MLQMDAREFAFADSVRAAESKVRAGVMQLHAHIFSKQPERIFWQPPARLVRSWGEPRSWFQRLKLRRGFGWLRCLSEVRLRAKVERFVPPEVELTGKVYYPGAATKKHTEMGRPVMYMAHLGEGVKVDYAPSKMRPLWVDQRVKDNLERLAGRIERSEEFVLLSGLDSVARAYGVGLVMGGVHA
jgi:hypothetical protein